MSDKELEIFSLCERLVELLGDKEAIADLKLLYKRHPEMFKDMQDVSNTIKEVIREPEIIVDNPRARSDKDYIVSSKLNDEKMGDVGIRNDKGINVIYHANKKKISEFYRLKDRAKKQVVGSPISYTQAQSLDGLVENNISLTSDGIIPQSTKDFKAKLKEFNTKNKNNTQTKEKELKQ